MAALQRKLVHKQFNSPIGLYSDNNVKATLDRELKQFSNGTMGMDFDDSSKPTNLANSAVLRLLEEEEQQKRNQAGGLKRVAWPPAHESQSPARTVPLAQNPSSVQTEFNPDSHQYPNPLNVQQRPRSVQRSAEPEPIYHGQTQQYNPSQSVYPHQTASQQPIYQRQHSQSASRQTPGRSFPKADPTFMKSNTPSYLPSPQAQYGRGASPSTTAFAGGLSVAPKSTPAYNQQYNVPRASPARSHTPQYQSTASLPLSPDTSSNLLGWAHVKSPIASPTGYTQTQHPLSSTYGGGIQNQYQPQETDYAQQQQQYGQQAPPQAYQQQYQQNEPQQSFYRQPSPGFITLRQEAPISQISAPVYASDPAAASFGGGANMRGDQKWPPQEVKQQSEFENEARRKLALGPACRPRRVQKDYSQFFGQHALNATYPGYRAPPGTQHYPAN